MSCLSWRVASFFLVLRGAFCFGLLCSFFLNSISHLLWRGATSLRYPSCLRLGVNFFSSPRLSSLAIRITFRGICFCFVFFIFSSFLSLFFLLLACVYMLCLSYPVRRHGIALSAPFTALRCMSIVSLRRSFVITELPSLGLRMSTRGVLGVDL